MQDIKNEEYIICPRCGREVYKEAVTCPFCNFGIMVWLEGEINENGAWDRVKHWLPKEYQKEEIDICDISKKEVTDDEYF